MNQIYSAMGWDSASLAQPDGGRPALQVVNANCERLDGHLWVIVVCIANRSDRPSEMQTVVIRWSDGSVVTQSLPTPLMIESATMVVISFSLRSPRRDAMPVLVGGTASLGSEATLIEFHAGVEQLDGSGHARP